MEGLVEGRIVHYVAFNNRHLAAIVIGVGDDKFPSGVSKPQEVDLTVFTNMKNVNNVKNFGMQFHQDIGFSEEKKPGTWHWIERA